MISFSIPGEPTAKGRHRSSIRRTATGKAFIRNYTPTKTAKYEDKVGSAAMVAMVGKEPLDQALRVTLSAYIQIPQSWSKKKKAAALAGEVFPTCKPDIDNIGKAVLDGMNGIVFKDDSCVCDVFKRKRYSDNPRVEVTVDAIV